MSLSLQLFTLLVYCRLSYATCFIDSSNNIGIDVASNPCTNADGIQNCCVGNDICSTGQQNFCKFTHPEYNTTQGLINVSGYYIARCTDSTYSSPKCSHECSNYPTLDVVYNATTGLWACCFKSKSQKFPDCSNPGSETFEAPSPNQLFGPMVSSSGPLTTTLVPSETTTVVSTMNALSTSSSNESATSASRESGLSSGDKAAICMGTVIGLFACGLVIYIFWCQRKEHISERGHGASENGDYTRKELPAGSTHSRSRALSSSGPPSSPQLASAPIELDDSTNVILSAREQSLTYRQESTSQGWLR